MKRSAITPKLRFSEFLEDWKAVTVGDFFDLTDKAEKAETFEKDKLLTVRLHANGVVKNEKTTLTGGANYFKRNAGQFIFSKIDLLNGAFGIVPDELDSFASSSDVPAFSFGTNQSPLFFLNWLKSSYQRIDVERTGTSSTLKRVSPEAFLAVEISAPTKAEQQKIAECLSTLDERIDAESQKLDALKAHKKGLMQQLFPREGETLPRLRFPEFQDAPEWEETTIGAIGRFYYGKSAPKWSLAADAPTPCVRYGELYTTFDAVITKTYSRTNIDPSNLRFSKGGEILVPRVGEKPEDFGKCCCFLPLAGIAIGEMISVFETDQSPLFYTYYFRNLYRQFAKVVEGQNVKNLYYTELEPLPIYKPTNLLEQQRIAACLSSLDDLIAAQSDQIEVLKTHKKGLMQQLFPSPAEGAA